MAPKVCWSTPGDVEQLRAAMARLHHRRAGAARGRQRAHERARAFDVHAYARRLADIYQRIAPVAEMQRDRMSAVARSPGS